jgi:hypothetical protein
MRTRTPLLAVTIIGAVLALAPTAGAATPFTAGNGFGHDLAVGSDGTGHVVWLLDEEPNDVVHYCRVPAGGSACDGESTTLTYPGTDTSDISIGDAQVFTPVPNRVVIVANCWSCGDAPSGTTDRTFRWISDNNGVSFDAGTQVGNNLVVEGQAAWVNSSNLTLSSEGAGFQATDPAVPNPDTATATLATGGLFVFSPSVVYNEALDRAVYATNDLDTVKYAYRADATPTAAELNVQANWQFDRTLSGPEGDNDETHLSSGPSGIFLTYKFFIANDSRIGLRKFDPVSNTFGGASYIEGPDAIDNNSLDYPYHSQDPMGRIHLVWRTLHDDGRLRYARSDDGGASFTPAANLALRETFIDPIVEVGGTGTGFAVWRGIGSGSAIRVVVIDPQPEPAPPGGPGGPGGPVGPDTTPPTAGPITIGDSTLFPGQGTTFTFTSSEAGIAKLTVQKQVPGLRMRVRGRLRCVPQTRRRLRALRRQADSLAEFRRLVRRRRCKAYKRIGSITRAVAPGQNTINWNGRIAGRRLRPGRYRALLVITDSAGNKSSVERIRFRVLRRRR